MPIAIRSPRPFVTACLAASFVLSADSTNRAQSADAQSGARASYRAAIERVDALRQIQALLEDQAEAREAAARQAGVLQAVIDASRKNLQRAGESVPGMSGCFAALSRSLEDATQIAEQYQRAARESLSKASEFSRAASKEAAQRLTESGSAFERRHERKDALLRRVAEVRTAKTRCSSQLSTVSAAVSGAASSFQSVTVNTRKLVSTVDRLERVTLRMVDLAIQAGRAGWLRADIAEIVAPRTAALGLLRRRVEELDGVAGLNLRDPHPDAARRLSDYQDAVLRSVVEEDARRFLALLAQAATGDCEAAECPALLNRVDEQAAEARDARQQAEDLLEDVERTIQEVPGLGVFSSEPSEWLQAQTAVERAFDAANAQLDTVVTANDRLAASMAGPVAKALEEALAERRAAYQRVFGVTEPPEDVPSPALTAAPTPPPPGGRLPMTNGTTVKRHAFEVLALRSKESPDYGAYTYVIFPAREQRPEYQALLDAIVALTPAADPDAPIEVKKTTNLFEIPGKSAAPIGPDEAAEYVGDIENYDISRALSLVQTASDGVLTAPKVLRRFQRSPGPFLLTVPVPLERAKGVTELLLADLNGYPAAGFQDLVKSYQNDLIAAFPTTQTLWRPPWNQRVALGLMSIAVLGTGQNFVALRR